MLSGVLVLLSELWLNVVSSILNVVLRLLKVLFIVVFLIGVLFLLCMIVFGSCCVLLVLLMVWFGVLESCVMRLLFLLIERLMWVWNGGCFVVSVCWVVVVVFGKWLDLVRCVSR